LRKDIAWRRYGRGPHLVASRVHRHPHTSNCVQRAACVGRLRVCSIPLTADGVCCVARELRPFACTHLSTRICSTVRAWWMSGPSRATTVEPAAADAAEADATDATDRRPRAGRAAYSRLPRCARANSRRRAAGTVCMAIPPAPCASGVVASSRHFRSTRRSELISEGKLKLGGSHPSPQKRAPPKTDRVCLRWLEGRTICLNRVS
jgi:hypothetical protein